MKENISGCSNLDKNIFIFLLTKDHSQKKIGLIFAMLANKLVQQQRKKTTQTNGKIPGKSKWTTDLKRETFAFSKPF